MGAYSKGGLFKGGLFKGRLLQREAYSKGGLLKGRVIQREAYSKGGLFKGRLIRGGFKIFLIAGHIPVEIFLLVNYFFDATHTSSRQFFVTLWLLSFSSSIKH